MKWTAASNLLIHTQEVKDIISNARWSCMTLSHVYTSVGEDTPHAHSPEVIHEELTASNPNYAALTIRQLPLWSCNPENFRNGPISSVSFAFEDPNSSCACQLLRLSFTAFGNLRCTLRAWVPLKKPPQEK